MLNTYTPDRWVILEIKTPAECVYKILAGWRGGFASGDSWRLSSAIVDSDTWESGYAFVNESGSKYVCFTESEGMTMYMSEIYQQFEDSATGKGEIKIVAAEEFLKSA
jgi:hypothetical protein